MRRALLLLPALAGAVACGGGGPAAVTGDVFVVLDDGTEVEVVGAPVRLVADEARTDTALARLCASRRDALRGVDDDAARDAVSDRAWAARERLLRGGARVEGRTGDGARFRIDGVAPGSYRVWTDAVVQGERWSWTVPVTLGGGDSVHVSLGNAAADGDPFRCQLMMRMEEDAA